MIGLEFACQVFKKENKELAEKLKISAPNISAWIKGSREIPVKYLPQLSKIFNNLPTEFFQKEITSVDELKIRIHYIENALSWDDRHGELVVYNPKGKIMVNEFIDDYEAQLNGLRSELQRELQINSYQGNIRNLFEQLSTLSVEQKANRFGGKNPEEFIMRKLNGYLLFLAQFEVTNLELIDSIVDFLMNYAGLDKSRWMNQELFPNEKMLSFFTDLEELLKKHELLKQTERGAR